MLVPVGALIVIASVLGGFMMTGGNPMALWQPNEVVVIVGAAVGAQIIAQPIGVLKATVGQLAGIIKAGPGKQDYLDLLTMLAQLFNFARKEGLVGLEPHINNPSGSNILGGYPKFLGDHHALHFLIDNLELLTSGTTIHAHDFQELLEGDIEARTHEEEMPSKVLSSMADAFPGIGIVAAVLGIIVTMASIDGPPSIIGHHVGAALVGTFLGILLSYGFFQGLSTNLASKAGAKKAYLMAQMNVLVAIQKGLSPAISCELARRSLPEDVRPSSKELTESIRGKK